MFETEKTVGKFTLNILQVEEPSNDVTFNINLNVSLFTRILMVNYPTSN